MSFLRRVFATVGDWVTSKKVLTAMVTTAAATVIKDPGMRESVVQTGLVLLGGQGLADFGKAKKQ